jgi:UDPglucose 6-dehydrogenase
MVKVCVFGLWHLGSVTAAGLSSLGYEVIGCDEDKNIISELDNGRAPLFEPNLDSFLLRGISDGRLRFTTQVELAAMDVQILWVTFDTPVDNEDVADVEFVINKIKEIIQTLSSGTIIFISSQLPVGSVARLERFANQTCSTKNLKFACLPENLRLGNALNIFLDPDRLVVGVRSQEDRLLIEPLLLPITSKIEWMSVESAEMTKHAINAFLATSVTFANELASICEVVGADAKEVERGLKTESRIGSKAYLSPGGPYAGGTLARDIDFLESVSSDQHLDIELIPSVRRSNESHKNWVKRKLIENFPAIKCTKILVWGLAYKPGTDTLRRSLSVELIDWMLDREVDVRVFDPVVKVLPAHWAGRVNCCSDATEDIELVEVLIVGTEWPVFKDEIKKSLEVLNPNLLVIDANRFLQKTLIGSDLKYLAVGSKMKNLGK